MYRVLVCGGRNFTDSELLYKTLDKLHKVHPIDVIIEGDARGADRIAGYWARKNKIDNLKFPADWEKYGKSAGFRRNTQMLEEGKPSLVVAFDGGVGTKMMIKIAEKAGVPVIRVEGK